MSVINLEIKYCIYQRDKLRLTPTGNGLWRILFHATSRLHLTNAGRACLNDTADSEN